MTFLRGIWEIFRKDFLFELETGETLSLLLVFALSVLFLFNFSFDLSRAEVQKFFPGFFWLTVLFTSVLGFSKAIEIEQRGHAIQGILMTPIPRESIYLGKVLSSFVFLLLVEVVLAPLFVVFFGMKMAPGQYLTLAPPLVLGTLGLATIGTLMALICQVSPKGWLLFSLGYFPLAVPTLIASTKLFQGVFQTTAGAAAPWLRFLAVIDIVEMVVAVLLFEYLMEE